MSYFEYEQIFLKVQRFTKKTILETGIMSNCCEYQKMGMQNFIQLKMRRPMMFHTIQAQSGRQTFQDNFRLIIMYSVLTYTPA